MIISFEVEKKQFDYNKLINVKFDLIDILVLSAHPDDGEYGVGGVLLRCGDKTMMIEFSHGENASSSTPEQRLEELKLSTEMLKLRGRLLFNYPDGKLINELNHLSQAITGLISMIQPKIVFIPNRNDSHSDHRAIGYATIHALEQIKSTLRQDILILEYIINGSFKPDLFIDITETRELKTCLLKLFASQKRLQNECKEISLLRESEFGMEINCKYAEGFRLVNYITSKKEKKNLSNTLKILKGIDLFEKLTV